MKIYLQEDTLSPDEEAHTKIDAMREITFNDAQDLCDTVRDLQNAIKPRFMQQLHEDVEASVTPVWEAIEKANKQLKEKYELD